MVQAGQAVGPLGNVIEADDTTVKGHSGSTLRADANALVMLHRVAFVDHAGSIDKVRQKALLAWAQAFDLGQDTALVRAAAARRQRALEILQDRGQEVRRLLVAPQWRMAVGLGNRANAHEIGLALHGTYGWPVIPGSTVKGLTCAWAWDSGADREQVNRVLGLPRVGKAADAPAEDEPKAHRGTVRFLDALPASGPVGVTREVLTPHVQPYYTSILTDTDGRVSDASVPPAEYHNPVPVEFLVVDQGSFAIDLVGPTKEDVEPAAQWCEAALDELGVGAKTSSGYGYLNVTPVSRPGRTGT